MFIILVVLVVPLDVNRTNPICTHGDFAFLEEQQRKSAMAGTLRRPRWHAGRLLSIAPLTVPTMRGLLPLHREISSAIASNSNEIAKIRRRKNVMLRDTDKLLARITEAETKLGLSSV